jgi:hypothetical protein
VVANQELSNMSAAAMGDFFKRYPVSAESSVCNKQGSASALHSDRVRLRGRLVKATVARGCYLVSNIPIRQALHEFNDIGKTGMDRLSSTEKPYMVS